MLNFVDKKNKLITSTETTEMRCLMNEQMIGREISGCETLIMKAVWDSKEELSTPELIDASSGLEEVKGKKSMELLDKFFALVR